MDKEEFQENTDQLSFEAGDIIRQMKKRSWIPVFFLIVFALLEFYAIYQPYPQTYVGTDKIFVGKAKILLEEKDLSSPAFQDFWDYWVNDDTFMGEVLSRVLNRPPDIDGAEKRGSSITERRLEASSSSAQITNLLNSSIRPNLQFQTGPGYLVVSLRLPASENGLIRPFLKEFSPALMEKIKIFIEKIPDNSDGKFISDLLAPKLLTDPDSPPIPIYPSRDLRRIYAFIPLSVLMIALMSFLFLEFLEKRQSKKQPETNAESQKI